MIESITFAAHPASHGTARGALAVPAGTEPCPAVVVLQEYWGVNDHIKAIAERWAAAGFLALAVDLYRGQLAHDASRASKLMNELDRERALADIAGAVDCLRQHPRCAGKVGITGYCMGGAYTLAAAATIEGLAAVVPYYGLPPATDWSRVTAPIQAHFCRTDGWARVDLAERVQQVIQAQGGTMELFVYDAPHAFCNDTRADVYTPDAATTAWQRTLEFMRQHLA